MKLTQFWDVSGSGITFQLPQHEASSTFVSRSVSLKVHATPNGPRLDVNSGSSGASPAIYKHSGKYIFHEESAMLYFLQEIETIANGGQGQLFRATPVNDTSQFNDIYYGDPFPIPTIQQTIQAWCTSVTISRSTSDAYLVAATGSSNSRFTVTASFSFTTFPLISDWLPSYSAPPPVP